MDIIQRLKKPLQGFKTDMAKLNIVVYSYRNNTYVKATELELKLTDYEKSYLNEYIYWVTMTYFFKLCIVLDETAVYG